MRTLLSVMQTCSTHDATSRFTGSLAFSVAYGIRVDTPDNELFRTYSDVFHAMVEAMVPGTFLVDVFPFRESNRLLKRRVWAGVNLPQSSTYLRGSPVYGFTGSRTESKAGSTWPKRAQ